MRALVELVELACLELTANLGQARAELRWWAAILDRVVAASRATLDPDMAASLDPA